MDRIPVVSIAVGDGVLYSPAIDEQAFGLKQIARHRAGNSRLRQALGELIKGSGPTIVHGIVPGLEGLALGLAFHAAGLRRIPGAGAGRHFTPIDRRRS